AWVRRYSPLIRRAAGWGGREPIVGDHAAPAETVHDHADVLVVGAGTAGLAAAHRLGTSGLKVMLTDQDVVLGGGSLLDARWSAWRESLCAGLAGLATVRCLPRTTVLGAYGHGVFGALETLSPPEAARFDGLRERLRIIRARRVVCATGALERLIAFPGNDLPGVMLAGAAHQYLRRYGVAVGRRPVFFLNSDEAYEAVFALSGAAGPGVDLPADADVTPIAALWDVRGPAKAFVDLQNDVTAADVRLSCREGFEHVEHMKRFTTHGMATDQGRIGGLVGSAVLAQARGVPLWQVGQTRPRPFAQPVPFAALAGGEVREHYRPKRRLPLHDWHEAAGATFVSTGLWLRPLVYSPRQGWEAVLNEARAVRRSVGITDVSTLGKIDVQGPDAARFLDFIYASSFATLAVGRARYGIMLREDGMLLDDGTTSRLAPEHFLVTTTTANATATLEHMEFHLQAVWPRLDVLLTDVGDQWAQFAVAGPRPHGARAPAARRRETPGARAPPAKRLAARRTRGAHYESRLRDLLDPLGRERRLGGPGAGGGRPPAVGSAADRHIAGSRRGHRDRDREPAHARSGEPSCPRLTPCRCRARLPASGSHPARWISSRSPLCTGARPSSRTSRVPGGSTCRCWDGWRWRAVNWRLACARRAGCCSPGRRTRARPRRAGRPPVGAPAPRSTCRRGSRRGASPGRRSGTRLP